jgi:[protein-PII] uridylyltransferase
MAVTVFEVRPRFGDLPDITVLRQDLRRAAEYPAAVQARIAGRERATRPDVWSRFVAPPRVLWFDDESAHATIVEVRAHDSAGLLFRLARVLAEAGLDVSRARIQTLGAEVVDAFYVTGPGGAPVTDPQLRAALEPRLLSACQPAS